MKTNISSAAERPSITVTMTSYPARIATVHKVVENMLAQTMKPDRIVLWLANEQFPEGEQSLPDQLLRLRDSGLVIGWCSDTRSYKKLLPALERYPDDLLITVDDDLIYDERMIELLYDCYRQFPYSVAAMRTHLMRFAPDGTLLPYKHWRREYGRVLEPSMALFATTGGGTLFPPHILLPCASDIKSIQEACPNADDIWLKVMLTLAGVPVTLAAPNCPLRYVPGTQNTTLWNYNLSLGGNDEQLAAAAELCEREHGVSADELIALMRDPSYDFCPEISAIVTVSEGDDPNGLIEDALSGTQHGIEVVCVDNCSGMGEALKKHASNDRRVRIVTPEEKTNLCECARLGLEAAQGDYVIFLSPDDRLGEGFVETLMSRAVHHPDADIIRFAANMLSPEADAVYPDAWDTFKDGGTIERGEQILPRCLLTASADPADLQYLLCDKLFTRQLCLRARDNGAFACTDGVDGAFAMQLLIHLSECADSMVTISDAGCVYHSGARLPHCGDSMRSKADALCALRTDAPTAICDNIRQRLLLCAAQAVLRGELPFERLCEGWGGIAALSALERGTTDPFAIARCISRQCAHSIAQSIPETAAVLCEGAPLSICGLNTDEMGLRLIDIAPDEFDTKLPVCGAEVLVYAPADDTDARRMLHIIATARLRGLSVLVYLGDKPTNGTAFDSAFLHCPDTIAMVGAAAVSDIDSGALLRIMGENVVYLTADAEPELWREAINAACISAPPLPCADAPLAHSIACLISGSARLRAQEAETERLNAASVQAARLALHRKRCQLEQLTERKDTMERDLRAHLDKYAADAAKLKQHIRDLDTRCANERETSRKLREEIRGLREELEKANATLLNRVNRAAMWLPRKAKAGIDRLRQRDE
ncbi:MAG: glycosyltransferase [Ruminococcaceae bacterium]|nr:glycosyltransferase [Oscillospiraceae bacterium]